MPEHKEVTGNTSIDCFRWLNIIQNATVGAYIKE